MLYKEIKYYTILLFLFERFEHRVQESCCTGLSLHGTEFHTHRVCDGQQWHNNIPPRFTPKLTTSEVTTLFSYIPLCGISHTTPFYAPPTQLFSIRPITEYPVFSFDFLCYNFFKKCYEKSNLRCVFHSTNVEVKQYHEIS